MHGISKQVISSQADIHPRLLTVLMRYRQRPDQKPVAAHTQAAFKQLIQSCALTQPMILDSGCGTGESTRALSRRYPSHTIVGVDQSASRLARAGLPRDQLIYRQGNCLYLRAELMDLCRLLCKAGIRFDKHYALYPNPWPKPAHLQRRYHAHPAFSDMLSLSTAFELRTNWSIYARECAVSVQHIAGLDVQLTTHVPDSPISAFERKYFDSGHELFRLTAEGLGANL